MSKTPDILFEDEHLIAVNKSADLLSIPDIFYADRANAKTEIEQKKGKLYVITLWTGKQQGFCCSLKQLNRIRQ